MSSALSCFACLFKGVLFCRSCTPASPSLFNSGTPTSVVGTTFTVEIDNTFQIGQSYPYTCGPHCPGMAGVLNVVATCTPPTTTTPPSRNCATTVVEVGTTLAANLFVPDNLSVQIGDTISFVWVGEQIHNVIHTDVFGTCAQANPSLFFSGAPTNNNANVYNVEITAGSFNVGSTYFFACGVHCPAMAGSFTVDGVCTPTTTNVQTTSPSCPSGCIDDNGRCSYFPSCGSTFGGSCDLACDLSTSNACIYGLGTSRCTCGSRGKWFVSFNLIF